MKLPEVAKLRIPMLLLLAVGETVGLAYFRGHRIFELFAALSTTGILLIVPLLWVDWMQRKGVPYFPFFVLAFSFDGGMASWHRREMIFLAFWAAMFLSLATLIAVKLARSADQAQQEANLAAIRARGQEFGPVSRNLVGFVAWLMLALSFWSLAKSPISLRIAAPIVLIGFWFAWRLVVNLHHFFRGEAGMDSVSIERNN